jgi:MOSC domain-containing protein YiiM
MATVVAVAIDPGHHFSKTLQTGIRLLEGHGVEGDAHAGPYVRHRYLARRRPHLPNLRQVHLMPDELFRALRGEGYDIRPGQLGENITTSGLELEILPLGSMLSIGASAIIELTGLRTPCVLLDRFQPGLKQKLILKGGEATPHRAGVLGIVKSSGPVTPGDDIAVTMPPSPRKRLPLL